MEEQIKINGIEYQVGSLGLKQWARLNSLHEKIEEAVSNKDYRHHFELVIEAIETASLNIPVDWEIVAWYEVVQAFSVVVSMSMPKTQFPILAEKAKKKEKLPWEYEGRSWYFWLNLFASNYGWTENHIEFMAVDTAIGLYQEITMEKQFDQEWEWGLSEIAYPYNPATKEQSFKALDRPDWMIPMAKNPKPIIKIRRDMMPQGNVIDLTEKHG